MKSRTAFRIPLFVPVLALVVTAGSSALSSDWLHWRGPLYNGATDDSATYPATFSKSKGVKWVGQLPGTGASTPIVSGDLVFVTSVDEEKEAVVAVTLDRQSGEVLWTKELGQGIRKDDRSDFAGPSAVADGERVIFFTGNGYLEAFDYGGKSLWKRDIQKDYGEFAFGWTFSTSPLIFDEKMYLQVLQRDTAVDGRGFTDKMNESYLLALNVADGEELWKVLRPTDAQMESREAFTSPVIATHNGKTELLVVGGDFLTGHDPATGEETWRWGTWNRDHKEKFWRLVPSPVYGDGIILACAPKKQPVFGIRAGGSGNLGPRAVAWSSASNKDVTADVPTPLFYEGRFYILNEGRKILSCVEPTTGKVLWSGNLDAKVKLEASPTAADGKIYLMSHLGEVFVVKAGDKFELLHQTTLGETQSVNIRASIVPSHGNLFIRTDDKIYCIGE